MKPLLLPMAGSIAVSTLVQIIEHYLQTDFFTAFLRDQLITIIITVLAINAATLSITLGKVRELIDQHGGDFSVTRRACMHSLIEQFVLILLACIFLTAYSSPVATAPLPWLKSAFAVGFTACFFQELWVLFDTTKSVFVVLDYGKK